MIVSKFKYWIILIGLISIVIIGIGVVIIYHLKDIVEKDTPILFKVFFIIWYLFFASIIMLGEVRTKCVKVTLYAEYLERAAFFGLGLKSKYYYLELEGYSLSDLYSKGRMYEYLYIVKDGKKIVKISEFYHANYFDLKNMIIRKDIRNLGKIRWSVFTEIKDTFTF